MNLKILFLLTSGLLTAGGTTAAIVVSQNKNDSSDTLSKNEESARNKSNLSPKELKPTINAGETQNQKDPKISVNQSSTETSRN